MVIVEGIVVVICGDPSPQMCAHPVPLADESFTASMRFSGTPQTPKPPIRSLLPDTMSEVASAAESKTLEEVGKAVEMAAAMADEDADEEDEDEDERPARRAAERSAARHPTASVAPPKINALIIIVVVVVVVVYGAPRCRYSIATTSDPSARTIQSAPPDHRDGSDTQ